MPTAKYDHALVIGGGIVGLCCAIALRGRGIPTTLVAPGPMRGTASWGNAGHIAVEQIEPLASFATVRSLPHRLFLRGGALSLPPRDVSHWLPFGLRLLAAARPTRFAAGKAALTLALARAVPAWRRLLTAIAAPQLMAEAGHFILWESEKRARAGRASWAGPAIGTARVRDATPDEIARIATLLPRRPAGMIRFEGSGHITDIDALAQALERAFLRAGGERRIASVRSLAVGADGGAAILLDAGGTMRADAIVLAAGAASSALTASVGHCVPMIAERGYHIQAPASAWPNDLPPVVFEDRSMIVTRYRNALRAASFVEFSALSSPPDPRKWQRLRAHAAALGLPFEGEPTEWIGARPTLPDYLPAIGRSPRASNLFYAFGHQHLGLTLGPLTGEWIGALVTGEEPSLDLSPFDPGRFGR